MIYSFSTSPNISPQPKKRNKTERKNGRFWEGKERNGFHKADLTENERGNR